MRQIRLPPHFRYVGSRSNELDNIKSVVKRDCLAERLMSRVRDSNNRKYYLLFSLAL